MNAIADIDLVWSAHPLGDMLEQWHAALPHLVSATPQDFDFASQWYTHVNLDCIAVTAKSARGIEFLLPLEIVRKGLLQIAQFPGGSHANANFAPSSALVCEFDPAVLLSKIHQAVRTLRPQVDALLLERLVEDLDGKANCLVSPKSTVSPNVALSFALKPDFKDILKDRNGSKKQKKMRQMVRRMDDRGGWRVFKADTEAECIHVLNRFFKLKGERLKSMGLKDVFADPKVQSFFKALYIGALDAPSPRYELHALEVGGDIAAVGGCTINGKHFTVEFGGICSTDRQLSPGDILYHLLIQDCCKRGFEIYDFGVGDEFYKRRWCDQETWHRDTFVALTGKGRLAVSVLKQVVALKKSVRSNPKLFAIVKKFRGKARAIEAE